MSPFLSLINLLVWISHCIHTFCSRRQKSRASTEDPSKELELAKTINANATPNVLIALDGGPDKGSRGPPSGSDHLDPSPLPYSLLSDPGQHPVLMNPSSLTKVAKPGRANSNMVAELCLPYQPSKAGASLGAFYAQ